MATDRRRPPSAGGTPFLGQTLRFISEPLTLIEDLLKRHGPVTRMNVFGLGELYNIAGPEGIEQALVTDRESFRKSEGFRVAFGENVLSTEGTQWQRQRNALDEFFYPARIREYADRIVELTQRRLSRWQPGTVMLHEEMSDTALDNFYGTIFDRPLDPDGDMKLRRAANDINLWFKPSSFALPRWVPTPARRRFHQAVEIVENETHRLLDERRRELRRGNADVSDDLLSMLVAMRDESDAALSDSEIVDQVVGLVFAGHDTTALAMTYSLHQIAAHPDVQQRFHAEVEEVLTGDQPTLSDIGQLEVTERILRETLRLYPPIHTIPRVTTESVEINGYHLKPETRSHLSVWAVHRDSRYWENPHEWRPTRWKDTSPRDAGYAYVPFGAGPRTCLGRRFALMEAKLVLAVVGQQFELDPLCGLEFAPMTTTQPAHGVPVRISPR